MATFQYQQGLCCGLLELNNISALPGPKEIVDTFVEKYLPNDGTGRAFVVFSGVVGARQRVYPDYNHADRSDDYGQALADYLTTEGLGTVTASSISRNYNGNPLRIWVWAPDWNKLMERLHALRAAKVA